MLNEIRYVYAVYQERSFTKAAKKLFISQPALSNMIKKAEREIGCPIFDRSTVPLTLTKEGEFYIQSISQILHLEKNLHDYFDDIQNINTGTLSIGGSSFFCSFVLPRMIGKFHTIYPNISINLLEGNVETLRKGLETEHLDLIMETSVKEDDPTIDTYLYKTETIILALQRTHPFNQSLTKYQWHVTFDTDAHFPIKSDVPPVPLIHFKDTPFILLKDGNDLGNRGIAICKESGFSPKIGFLTDQILTAANIAANSNQAVFLRADLFRYYPIHDKFCIYTLNSELSRRKVYFATKKGRYISNAVKTFLRLAGVEVLSNTTKSHVLL